MSPLSSSLASIPITVGPNDALKHVIWAVEGVTEAITRPTQHIKMHHVSHLLFIQNCCSSFVVVVFADSIGIVGDVVGNIFDIDQVVVIVLVDIVLIKGLN